MLIIRLSEFTCSGSPFQFSFGVKNRTVLRNMAKLWRPYAFRTSVHCGIFRILHECISLLLRTPLWTYEPATLFNQATHCSMLEEGKMTSNLMPSPSFDTYHQQGQSRSLVGAIGHRPGGSSLDDSRAAVLLHSWWFQIRNGMRNRELNKCCACLCNYLSYRL